MELTLEVIATQVSNVKANREHKLRHFKEDVILLIHITTQSESTPQSHYEVYFHIICTETLG